LRNQGVEEISEPGAWFYFKKDIYFLPTQRFRMKMEAIAMQARFGLVFIVRARNYFGHVY